MTLSVGSAYASLTRLLDSLRNLFLLAIRLYWGWQFFLAGKGKFGRIDQVTEFFQSIHIPYPKFNAYLAGSAECFGGFFLLLGLASRMASIPLIITMVVAYLTAHLDAVKTIFSNPDTFLQEDPFLFLMAALIVLLFGPGVFSLDYLIRKYGVRK